MKSSSLKKWGILKHLKDDELANIKYLQVYGGFDGSPVAELSALYVTHDDEVFGTGLNSMLGMSPAALTFDEEDSRGKSVKVEALSGLGITKIVVGKSVGAALSNNGEVYTWGYFGEPQVLKVKPEDIVMFESYVPNKCCMFCNQYNYTQVLFGSTPISRCIQRCNKYPTYTTASPPPPGTAVRGFVKFSESVFCPECEGPTSSKGLNGSNFHFCVKCNKMLELPSDEVKNVWLRKSKFKLDAPQKLGISELWKIDNIYCGSSFLIIETSSPNRLFLFGTIDGSKYRCCVTNPDSASFETISCGGSHFAAITSSGKLYTCGRGNKGQLGYKWTPDMGHRTLRMVSLDGTVENVCCGYSSTACLMSNGSIVCFGSNMEKLSSGALGFSCDDSKFIEVPTNISEYEHITDIAHAPLTNVYCAKTKDLIIFVWGKLGSTEPEVQFKVSELGEAMADMPYSFTDGSRGDTVEQLSLHSISLENEQFFNNKSFSDLTLKLADGEFPVHCLFLLSNSTYFKEILSDEEFNSNTLDMTSYNPTAYKCLLKYFYRLPLDDLDCDDLFDLHSIACSYKEKELVDFTFKKLKTMINQDTVLKLHAKATSTIAEDVLRECELFLSSPEFKNDLISFVSQDMKNAIAILRVKSGE